MHDGHHSGLLLEADDRRALIVAGEEFAAMIGRVVNNPASSLRLIVLDSCHTATMTQATALHSTAVEMVRSGAAAVIAMRGAITPQSARAFTAAFYTNLLQHGLVDLAANQARSTLLAQRREDAFLPVLYMRLPEGALLQQGAPA
ncbi:MAG: CHAT domain-containing protein [Anaerolineales bacterium]|nr:CHAT domain-containing protein [Anaerolineales bacterium]